MTVREYLNLNQITINELSQRSGVSATSISRFLNGQRVFIMRSRQKLARLGINDFTRPNWRDETKVVYAVYKGDQFLAVGTAAECAKSLGVKVNTVYSYAVPSRLTRLKKPDQGTYAIKIEDEE